MDQQMAAQEKYSIAPIKARRLFARDALRSLETEGGSG
jgi:hypothetical protein